jgi:hypothetical protein
MAPISLCFSCLVVLSFRSLLQLECSLNEDTVDFFD